MNVVRCHMVSWTKSHCSIHGYKKLYGWDLATTFVPVINLSRVWKRPGLKIIKISWGVRRDGQGSVARRQWPAKETNLVHSKEMKDHVLYMSVTNLYIVKINTSRSWRFPCVLEPMHHDRASTITAGTKQKWAHGTTAMVCCKYIYSAFVRQHNHRWEESILYLSFSGYQ